MFVNRRNATCHAGPPSGRRLVPVLMAVLLLGCGSQPVDQLPSPPPPPPGPPPPLPPPPPPQQVTVTVSLDTTQRFQVMSGWEAVAQAGQEMAAFPGYKNRLYDLVVSDLGINRLRLEVRSGLEHDQDNWALRRAGQLSDAEWRARRYQVVNDNADPNVINPAGFKFSSLDNVVDEVVIPIRQRLVARGEQLRVSLCYVAFNSDGGYVHGDPAEYAEFVLAMFLHLRDRYGVVPDAFETILEPDNGTWWTAARLGPAVAAAVSRLAAAGFHPEIVTPSTESMSHAVSYFDAMVQVPGVLPAVAELSYHRYSGVSDNNLAAIAARGAQQGVRTAMLEHIGSGVDDLYKDLTIANASAWEQFTLAFPTSDNGAQYYIIQNGQPVMGSRTRDLRQYFRYVRMGARRVAATSDKAAVRSVGFTNVGGGPVVVLHLGAAEVVRVRGLRPGRYEVTTSVPSTPSLGESTVASDGELRFAAPAAGVLTVTWLP